MVQLLLWAFHYSDSGKTQLMTAFFWWGWGGGACVRHISKPDSTNGVFKETAPFEFVWDIFCSSLLCVCVCVFPGLHIHYGNYRWQPEMTPACYVSSELASQEGHGPRSVACIHSRSVYLCVGPSHINIICAVGLFL